MLNSEIWVWGAQTFILGDFLKLDFQHDNVIHCPSLTIGIQKVTQITVSRLVSGRDAFRRVWRFDFCAGELEMRLFDFWQFYILGVVPC